jgi:hypothetical protein
MCMVGRKKNTFSMLTHRYYLLAIVVGFRNTDEFYSTRLGTRDSNCVDGTEKKSLFHDDIIGTQKAAVFVAFVPSSTQHVFAAIVKTIARECCCGVLVFSSC